MPLDSVTKVEGGIWMAIAGAVGWVFNSFLRWIRVSGQEKDKDADRELRLSHSTLEYADSLKEHVQRLEDKIDAQQREISEMHDLVRGLYQRNDELRRQNEEYARHLAICTLATA